MSTAVATYAEERRGWRTAHTFSLFAIVAGIGVIGVALPRTSGQLGYLGGRTVLAWLLIAALMAAFAAVAGHGVTGLARFRGEEVADHDHLDLGKVQMFLFTVVLILGYALAVGDMLDESTAPFTARPAVDEGVVTLLAISHAGYLTRKALPTGSAATPTT